MKEIDFGGSVGMGWAHADDVDIDEIHNDLLRHIGQGRSFVLSEVNKEIVKGLLSSDGGPGG